MRSLSLRRRLTGFYFSFFVIIFSLSGFIAYQQMRRQTLAGIDDELRGKVQALEQSFQNDSNSTIAEVLQKHEVIGYLVQVTDPSGNWIYRSPRLQQEGVTMTFVEPAEFRFATVGSGEHKLRVLTANLHARAMNLSIQTAAPLYVAGVTVGRFRLALLVFVPLALMVAFVGGHWLSGKALKPLHTITSRARLISRENLSDRLPLPSTHDELYRLAETLNAMLDRLEVAFRRITQFTADASHELRTPLALIRTTAEVCNRKPRSDAEYRAALRQIISEVDRTTDLIEGLLFLARTDADIQPFAKVRINLVALIEHLRGRALLMAAENKVGFDVQLPTYDVTVYGDFNALERLVMVLIHNAIKFTPAGGRVNVRLVADDGAAVITVTDTGIGIPDQDLPHIYDRFYQVDPARSHEGVGLGLAIARSVADAHGAAISCSSAADAGSTFVLRVPLA